MERPQRRERFFFENPLARERVVDVEDHATEGAAGVAIDAGDGLHVHVYEEPGILP